MCVCVFTDFLEIVCSFKLDLQDLKLIIHFLNSSNCVQTRARCLLFFQSLCCTYLMNYLIISSCHWITSKCVELFQRCFVEMWLLFCLVCVRWHGWSTRAAVLIICGSLTLQLRCECLTVFGVWCLSNKYNLFQRPHGKSDKVLCRQELNLPLNAVWS